ISPVSTLMKWFPDRPGLATGLAIMGFGGGALIASPLSQALMKLFGGGTETEDLAAGLVPTFITLAISYGVIIAAGASICDSCTACRLGTSRMGSIKCGSSTDANHAKR